MLGWLNALRAQMAGAEDAPPPADELVADYEGTLDPLDPVLPATELPPVGATLDGRYELLAFIAKGGAGAVYRARDRALGQDVAVKVLLPDGGVTQLDQDDAARAGLRSEAVAAMRLAHPSIARVYHFEDRGPYQYLVMEMVPGKDLHRIVNERGGPLAVDEVIAATLAVLDALAFAHGEGLIHNDIKPKNILRDHRGMIKVCDFGLARPVDGGLRRAGGSIAGTRAFICPERIAGREADHRGDLYSLGATMYALLTGRAPFGARGDAVLSGHLYEPLPPDERIPPTLYRVIERAMAKRPADRFPSAAAMAQALAGVQLGRQLARGAVTRDDAVDTFDDLVVVTEPTVRPIAAVAVAPVTPVTTVTPATPAPAVSVRSAPSPAPGMVRVPTARVRFGDEAIDVRSFDLDALPVTNAAYAAYIAATREPAPPSWIGARPPAGQEDHPVTDVTLVEARAFAAWAGKRLPTGAEWVAALRGAEGRKLPWGDACEPTWCACPNTSAAGTIPVGDRPQNVTPDGVRELLGNVWEWVERDALLEPEEDGYAYVFGGSFRHRCGAQGGDLPHTVVSEHAAYRYVGFRCARTVEIGR